eukprot:scaffold286183_cov27-Tisochrysis_lutea.AAC.1
MSTFGLVVLPQRALRWAAREGRAGMMRWAVERGASWEERSSSSRAQLSRCTVDRCCATSRSARGVVSSDVERAAQRVAVGVVRARPRYSSSTRSLQAFGQG